jgi:L-ribulokinase
MGGKREAVFTPRGASADTYDELYAEYVRLHDYFGRGANEVMHRLRAIRDRVLAAAAADSGGPSPDTGPGSAPSGRPSPDSAAPASVPAGGQERN